MAKEKRLIFDKLHALRKLCYHMGLIPYGVITVSDNEIAKRIKKHGKELPILAVLILCDDHSPPYAKSAAGSLLEIFYPTWKDHLPKSLIGATIDRDSPENRLWREDVLRRDKYTCVKCGNHTQLHAHHIARWSDHPHLRIEVDNGITLCKKCHEKEHRK